MKRLWILATLSLFFLLSGGCGDGVEFTHRERMERWQRSAELDRKMIVDDVDLLLLEDRQSRLSRFRIP